jgi:hypothetical protein
MTATYTRNAAGETTGVEYEKTTHCTENCVWFSENVVPAIHGEALQRTSTLAKEEYTYDNVGRLTLVKEMPVGKACNTRGYEYNTDSERTALTHYTPGEKGECATSAFNREFHSYDAADRLIDTGVEYETFGDQTKVPESDTEKQPIAASFYVDGQIASQKQNGETSAYSYDPAGRTEKTISEGTTNATAINHYPGPGEAIAWTQESEGWTRDIPGVDGTLTATQHDGEAAILQLHDLEGNIIATAALSETETKLLTTYNPTEFGVSVNGAAPTKFSWFGAGGLATEQASGAANPGGTSYVTQLGKPLETQPVIPPGAFPNGSYTGGPYATKLEPWVNQSIGNWGTGGTEREAARQAAAKKKQEEEEAAWRADHYVLPPGEAPTPGAGGAEEPTLEEWIRAEEAFDRIEGIAGEAHTAGVVSTFKNWVKGIAHGATDVANYLYENSIFDRQARVRQAKKGWKFYDEIFAPEGLGEMTLSCYKDGSDDAEQIDETAPPPYNKVFVPFAAVLGCIEGVAGG